MHFKRLNEKWRYYFIDVISVLNGNMKDAPAIEFDEENILAMEKLIKSMLSWKNISVPFPGKIQTSHSSRKYNRRVKFPCLNTIWWTKFILNLIIHPQLISNFGRKATSDYILPQIVLCWVNHSTKQ